MAMLFLIMIADHAKRPQVSILQWFGLKIDADCIVFTIKGLLLNSVLFAGEIFQYCMGMAKNNYRKNIECFKNLVVAPLFEEFIYRVCMINLMVESDSLSEWNSVLIVPFFFAISHLHHEIFVDAEKNVMQLLAKCTFRITYTQIFGIYSGLVYIKTGSIWPAIFLHS